MAHHRVQQWTTFTRFWWLYDAKWQDPFKSASLIAKYLSGKHKPIYHPLSDVGDHVVVINTKEIAMEGDLWRTFKHFHHTGYPRGFSQIRAYKVHDADPTRVLYKAVYSTVKGTLLRRPMMEKLHLFPDEKMPDDIRRNLTGQIRQVMPVPRRLDEYSQQERENFPKLFDWPADYIISPGNKKIKSS
jgi:large subunit ribosomal protein L13